MMTKLTDADVATIASRANRASKVAPGPWDVVQDPARSAERRLIVRTADKDLVINVDAFWVPYDPQRKGNLNLDAFGQINDVAQFVAASINDVESLIDDRRELRAALAAREAEVGRLKNCLDGLLLSYSGFTKSLGYDWEETKKLPAIDDALAALADHTP